MHAGVQAQQCNSSRRDRPACSCLCTRLSLGPECASQALQARARHDQVLCDADEPVGSAACDAEGLRPGLAPCRPAFGCRETAAQALSENLICRRTHAGDLRGTIRARCARSPGRSAALFLPFVLKSDTRKLLGAAFVRMRLTFARLPDSSAVAQMRFSRCLLCASGLSRRVWPAVAGLAHARHRVAGRCSGAGPCAVSRRRQRPLPG